MSLAPTDFTALPSPILEHVNDVLDSKRLVQHIAPLDPAALIQMLRLSQYFINPNHALLRSSASLHCVSVYSNSYECLPSAILIVSVPASPASSPVPESGTTLTISCGSPRVIVPLCWSTKLPLRPFRFPVTRSIAT